MNEAIYDQRYIVSALSNGKLRLEAFLSPIEAQRYAENLTAETRWDDKPRYERVQIFDEKAGLAVEVLGYSTA